MNKNNFMKTVKLYFIEVFLKIGISGIGGCLPT